MREPRIGSLFSGIGGLDMGVKMATGGEVAWFAENNEACSLVLAANVPEVPNHGDITTVDWSSTEPVDMLVGGYPCQPFSTAGKRLGKDDDRHLWPHFQRGIAHHRPMTVVLENVPGHLSNGFGDVLRDLVDLGYSARWGTLSAGSLGAPHGRNRLFVVASLGGFGRGYGTHRART